MRVFLTGVLGFCGSNLVRFLERKGDVAGGIDLPQPETEAGRAMGLDVPNRGDVRRYEDVLAAVKQFEPDVVVHLAAVSTVQVADENPVRAWMTNVMGTVNVLEVCRREHLPVVVASSDKAYGSNRPPFREHTTSLNPLYPYDVSKACQDFITRSYAKTYGLPAVVTRACNYYGPADLHWSRLVPRTFRALVRGEPPVLHQGMEHVRREWIHVDDVCSAYYRIMENLVNAPSVIAGQAFNIGSGTILSVRGMMTVLLTAADRTDVTPRVEPAGFSELGDEYLDNNQLSVLGWKPQVSLEDGLKSTWKWYQQYLAVPEEAEPSKP